MSLTLRDTHDRNSLMGVTVDEAISFVVEALKDPLNPRWCAPSILACILVIQPDDGGDYSNELKTLINHNHPLCSTIVTFLTVKRPITAIKKLGSHWSNCRCSYADFTDHVVAMPIHQILAATTMNGLGTIKNPETGRDEKVDSFQAVIRNLSRFFENAVGKAKPFSIAQGRHPEIWPASPKDLIPYGAETTIESLVTWSRFMGSARLFSIIGLFFNICGPVIVPAIVASRSAPSYMIEHGLQICSNISSAPLNSDGHVDAYTAEVFIHELRYTGSFIHAVINIPPLLYRDFHFGFAQSAFDFATQVISTIESPIIPESHRSWLEPWPDRLAQYAATIYTTLAEQMTTPKANIHPTINAVMVRMTTPSPPAEFACQMMRHARSLQFCYAPGCLESAQSSGRVYKRCSGCRIVAYSSKECQQRAWTDKNLPHKNICKKMKEVYDIGGHYLQRAEDEGKFVREMRRAKIKDVMLQEIGLWLSTAYAKLQRKGPLLTPSVRQYLSERDGPLYVEGAEEHLIEIETSLMTMPKRRKRKE